MGEIPTNDYLLPGAIKAFNKWYHRGCNIILTTGRPESMRNLTEKQLEYFHLFYDQLVMGLKNHPRVLINDDRKGMLLPPTQEPLAGMKEFPIPTWTD